MEKKCLYMTSVLCIEGPTDWFPDQTRSWEVDWVIFLIEFCLLISLSWFFFFLTTYYNHTFLSKKKIPYISHWERIVLALWHLVVGIVSIRACVTAEQWTRGSTPCSSWAVHTQTCTSTACAGKGERESVNQSAGEIRNQANFGVHGVNSRLWTCPTRKSCYLSGVIQFHEHWIS